MLNVSGRIFSSILSGAAGGVLAYLWARSEVSAEILESTNYAGLYAASGAAAGIVAWRLGTAVKAMFLDFFKN